MGSILTSIKKLLGVSEECDQYDDDLILYINTVLTILTQIGVGPANGFSILSAEETWGEFLGANKSKLEPAKTFVALKVRLMFDPPASSAVIEVINNQLKELEYRLYMASNPSDTF